MGCSQSSTVVESKPSAATGGAAAAVPIGKTKVLVLFYSTYGHNYIMAKAAAEGAIAAGADVDLRRVEETLPAEVLAALHATEAQKAFADVPLATPGSLADYDGIIISTPTRFGNMPAQLKTFLDATGQLFMTGALTGKVGGAMVSSGTQHGGNESTFKVLRNYFLHQGMVWAGLAFQGMMGVEEVKGLSPYGATTIAGGQGERLPSAIELEGATTQGKQIATYARKLSGKL